MKNKMFEKICRGLLFFISLLIVMPFLTPQNAGSVDISGVFISDLTPQQYAASNSLATSTHAVTGLGVSYMIYPVGSTCSYHLALTTATFINPTTHVVTPSIVISSEATIPANFILSDTFKIKVDNPKIVISGLATGATVYVWMDYGQYKTSWGGN